MSTESYAPDATQDDTTDTDRTAIARDVLARLPRTSDGEYRLPIHTCDRCGCIRPCRPDVLCRACAATLGRDPLPDIDQ